METPIRIAPVTIHQLESGSTYFPIGVNSNNELLRDAPFVYRSSGMSLDVESLFTSPIIRFEPLLGSRSPVGAHGDTLFAEGLGLLVGTAYPMRYGDNYWRTFPYTPENYKTLGEMVARQDLALYEQLVGKRERPTPRQQVERVITIGLLEAAHEMYLRSKGRTEPVEE